MIGLADVIGELAPLAPPVGGGGAMLALMVYLLKRGERKDDSATEQLLALIDELKGQVAYWRDRAEMEERARRRSERYLEKHAPGALTLRSTDDDNDN